jgi:hypothetical protein
MTTRDVVAFDPHPCQHIAAESLDKPKTFDDLAACTIDGDADRTVRQASQDLVDQREALLDLADADPHARVDIAGLEHRDLEVEPIIGRVGKRLARIEGAAAGASDIAAGAELPRQLAAQNAGSVGAVLQRGGIVVKVDELWNSRRPRQQRRPPGNWRRDHAQTARNHTIHHQPMRNTTARKTRSRRMRTVRA